MLEAPLTVEGSKKAKRGAKAKGRASSGKEALDAGMADLNVEDVERVEEEIDE